MSSRLPKIESYYPYASSNYGANSLCVEFDSIGLYYSYETIIAFRTAETGLVCRVNDWSTTTGKHLNAIQPDHKKRIKGEAFEEQLRAVLLAKGLSEKN